MSTSRFITGTVTLGEKKNRPTTPTTRRADADTLSRPRRAAFSTFHSYLLCDASLRPVESTRTFVNAFACSARWCDLHDYVYVYCVSMALTKRDVSCAGRFTFDASR